ncbi:MAG: TolC family protein [Pirellulales bacterium]|nr:TolC family protein [Pirellulales bacterium]
MIFGVAIMVCSICAAANNNQYAAVAKSESDITEIETTLTLEQCIEISLRNNPAVAQKQWEADTAQAEKDIAQGRLWPEISANAGYMHYRDYRLIQPRRPGTSESLQFTDELVSGGVVLNLPLYTGGRLVNQVKAADFITQSTKQQLLFSQAELVFNVSSVFYSILGQREVITSLIFSQKTLQEHYRKTMELLNAKKAARVDLLRTEVRLADIEQRIIYERNALNITQSLMISLLGLNIQNKTPDIEGELMMIDVPAGLGRGLETALTNRQDYKSLKSQLEAQQEILNIAKAGRLPEVSLRASYGNRWDADSSEDNLIGDIGIFVVIPIFEGGRIDAEIRRERSRLRAHKEALRKLELHIRLEVESAISNIESTRARVGVMQKAVEQARESLRIEREKYDQGKGAIVDVLDAQSAMLESQTNYYRSLSDYNTAVAQFRLAVGE